MHVDLSTDDDLEVQVERLVGLGAVEQGRHDFGAEFRWVVFADPDGNSFCLAAG